MSDIKGMTLNEYEAAVRYELRGRVGNVDKAMRLCDEEVIIAYEDDLTAREGASHVIEAMMELEAIV